MPNEVIRLMTNDDARQWFTAQTRVESEKQQKTKVIQQWHPPETGRLKCSIGFAWSKRKALSGSSWVLRDASGSVLCHSRRKFTQVRSCTT